MTAVIMNAALFLISCAIGAGLMSLFARARLDRLEKMNAALRAQIERGRALRRIEPHEPAR
jgi:hypothetical protein